MSLATLVNFSLSFGGEVQSASPLRLTLINAPFALACSKGSPLNVF